MAAAGYYPGPRPGRRPAAVRDATELLVREPADAAGLVGAAGTPCVGGELISEQLKEMQMTKSWQTDIINDVDGARGGATWQQALCGASQVVVEYLGSLLSELGGLTTGK